uniref:Eva-1 homolog C n=1 Tax=Amphilophus citrinellus TaxID=61819 RepID=A0A3Q0RMI0_AMPCI
VLSMSLLVCVKLVKSPLYCICIHSHPFSFTDYLSRIITSHSAHACDGQPLRLHCPRHSTISIQSAFYGSGEVQLCRADPDPPLRAHNHSCSAFTAVHLVSKSCYSKQNCAVLVSNQTFRDPCFPGTRKYLSVIYSCERKGVYGWEEVTYVSEAAERAERIERREMIMQEIWMNAYLNGSSC